MSLWDVQSKDNYDAPTTLLIGSDQAKPRDGEWSALELKSMILEFNRSVKEKLPADLVDEVDVDIALNDVKEGDHMVTWEIGNFYHVPLASVVTNLSRLQAEVRNIESDVIRSLYNKISSEDFTFDTLAVKVIPLNGSVVNIGEEYKAEVIVAAYSTTQNPRLLIGKYDEAKQTVTNSDSTAGVKIDGGIATWSTVPRAAGEQEWGGVIKIKKPNGEEQPYPFKSTFRATKPEVVVAPTKMNVFYRGLANPIEVSAGAIPTDKLQVSVTNGTLTKLGDGKFEVMPGNEKECRVTVVGELNGNKVNFPPQEFRVKPVPEPLPSFLGNKGSFKMTKGEAAGGQFITASLDDFLFDLKYKVNSFDMTVTIAGKSQTLKSTNNQLTQQMKDIFKGVTPGQKIIIDNIIAERVPGGKPTPLTGNLIIEIK
jgi:gliding motility-associated protein GldM